MSAFTERAPGAELDTRDTVRVGALEVDRTPVTNARYARFVESTGHRPPAYWPNGALPRSLAEHPVVGVDFFDALAFALWAGGSLPTELEWVSASGLFEQRAYVWGDDFDSARCNTVRSGVRGTTHVEAHPEGVAPSGCADLHGNVWEMTCSGHPGDKESIIVKGGSWYDYPGHARLDTRFRARVHRCGATVGFRLVYGRPARLPEHLEPDLVDECIAHRRGTAATPAAAAGDAGEYPAIVAHLRDRAHSLLPDLQDDLPGVDSLAVDRALELFDSMEFEPEPGNAAEPSERSPTLWARVRSAFANRPRTLLLVLALALFGAVGAVWAAVSGTAGPRSRRGRAPTGEAETPPARRQPPPVEAPARTPARVELSRAIHDILTGDARKRDAAEHALLRHPRLASRRVLEAMRADVSNDARASLRYVWAALEEDPEASGWRPVVVSAPPREGLFYFLERADDRALDELATVRRTAKAEGLPATVVLLGGADPHHFASEHARRLGPVAVYGDGDGALSARWAVKRVPAFAGLHADGRLAFIHIGPMARASLGQRAATLRR